ncbi:MAG: RecX family transcriptional regulator [Clostridiaceae bacterium]|nr:RecX family transcriptional regulator [Clostridiaceae bacterium]
MKTTSSTWNSDHFTNADQEFARQVQAGRTAILSWLAGRRRSSGRIAERLRVLEYTDEVIKEVVSTLTEDGYIDDERMARAVLKQYNGRRAEAVRKTAERLSRMGIHQGAIQSVLEEQDDLELAVTLLKTHLDSFHADLNDQGEVPAEKREKMLVKAYRHLASRGFNRATIFQAFARCSLRIDMDC